MMAIIGAKTDTRDLPRVLVSAYACNPYRGSEEGVGWGWVRMIAGIANPTVLVAAYHREDIERYLSENPDTLRHVSFRFVPHKPWHYHPTATWRRIEGSILKPIMNLAYALWLTDAYRLAKKLHAERPFELAHQLTYVGFRFPGHLWKLDIPFVWGPLGGIETTGWRLLPAMDLAGAIYHTAHNLVNAAHRRFLPTPRLAIRAAGPGAIAATTGVRNEIKRWYGVESRVICEVTAPRPGKVKPAARGVGEPLSLVWAGQHFSRKALPLLFRALATLSEDVGWRLSIYGSGPKTSLWKSEARRLGLERGCVWKGRVSRDEAIAGMARAHVFVITSLKDLTSTVLLEAMSQGVPILCPDHCGFSDVVTPSSGIRLPISTPGVFVAGLRDAITGLFHDEPRRKRLAVGAWERAKAFGPEAKAVQIQAVYDSVIEYRRETAHGRSV